MKSMVQNSEVKNGGLLIMEEKLYKKMKHIGASDLVFGIVTMVFGIGVGIIMIVNGAKLLTYKSENLF